MKRSLHISTSSGSNFESNIWTSIQECPIWNWEQVVETGKLEHLYKKTGEYTKRLIKIWTQLQQQLLDEFGVSDELASIIRMLKKLDKLNIKFIESGKNGRPKDRSILNFIKVQEAKIKERSEIEGMKFGKKLILAQKFIGQRINTREFSVYEWNHLLLLMEQEAKNG